MKMWIILTRLLTLSILVSLTTARDPKSIEHLSKCIKMAEPLVRDPKYIFPLNVQDIRDVCRMWEKFIDCVYEYANTYMGSSQQQDFNKTIQSNIEVIQQLCTEDPDYQKLYMAYAPCMKRVSIGPSHCGNQYRYLTDLVQGRAVTDGQLCCAHRKFRECVLDTTAVECDAGGMLLGTGGNSPSQFMREMLDQTMGFLLQKCQDFVPNSRDCPKSIFGVAAAGNSGSSDGDADDLIKTNNSPPPDHSTTSTSSSSSSSSSSYQPFSTTTPPSTRFTWTTKGPRSVNTAGPSRRPRPTSSVNLAGNGLLGPASQQFKDDGVGRTPALTTVVLTVLFVLKL